MKTQLNLAIKMNKKQAMFGIEKAILSACLITGLTACTSNDLFVKKETAAEQTHAAALVDKVEQVKRQEEAVKGLIDQAERALLNNDLALAEQLFGQVVVLDATNLRAAEGLRKVSIFKRHSVLVNKARVLLEQSADDVEAEALLRSVLVENPDNLQAARLYKKIVERADAKRMEAMRVKLKYDNQVSLEFRDTQLKVIIEALAKGTGINFVLDKDVKSNLKASLFIRDVTLENAIDMLVQSNQLKKKVLSENSVLIYPDTAIKTRQYQDLIIRTFFLEYANPTTVSKLLTSMLGIKQIQSDDRLPMIMIKDVPEVMALAEKLIKSQDVAEPEVMLEMTIFEVRRNAITDKGVTWPTQLSLLSTGALTIEGLKGIGSENIGVSPSPSIIFNGKDSNANLLANPRIRVKNKEKAKIHIGDRVPVITSNVSSNGVISDNVQYIDSGLKLEVEPDISMSGDVTIKLNLEVNSIGEKIATSTGALVPQIGTRSTSTQLRLKDGETQVLAGLINDEERKTIQKIPGLGDLPGLGRFFSSHTDDNIKTELVLTITPRIIRSRKSPDAELAEYWMGSDLHVGRGMSGSQSRTRAELSELFKVGVPPNSTRPAPPQPKKDTGPESLNMQLSPDLRSSF